MDEKFKEFDAEFSKFPLKKRRFLECFAQTGSVNRASQHAGVSRRTHLNWRKTDRRFAAACEDALTMFIEEIEWEVHRRGVEGVLEPVYYAGKPVGAIRKYSDNLLMFLLKALKPEKYRDNYNSFGEPPPVDREEVIASIEKKLQRLAQRTGMPPPQEPERRGAGGAPPTP
jgi:hypothetical protein